MKATGIVRRIDELGRVVIPKEIRRTMRIREGDPLEIYTDREGEVIFKKYSPMGEMNDFASQYAETIYKTCDLPIVITDRDGVIAVAGLPKAKFAERHITNELSELLENRQHFSYAKKNEKIRVTDDTEFEHYIGYASPMISEGDIIGCVASVCTPEKQFSGDKENYESKLIQTAASFLAKQHEN